MASKTTRTIPPLTALPPELLLHIFSYLDVQSLVSVQLVSKHFDALFKDPLNESVIWRNACVIHGLIGFARPCETSSPSNTTQPQAVQEGKVGSEPPRREWGRWREWAEKLTGLGGLKGEATDVVWSDVLDLCSSQSFIGLSTDVNWKAFFKRRLEIHHAFIGQLPSDIICYKNIDSSSDPDPNDGDSYLSKIRRIYEALIRIQGERKKRPPLRPVRTWASVASFDTVPETSDEEEGTADPSETALTDTLLSRFIHTLYQLLPTNESVHRIKVDERNGFFLTTSRVGGLVVRDMESKKVLWELPKSYVRPYAHLEYENGYIIFDRLDGAKEVWRSSSIPSQPPSTLVFQPDDRQHLASALTTPLLTSIDSDPNAYIRSKIRSEAMSTSHLPTRQRLLDMANSNNSSTTKRIPIEAIVRCAFSGETVTLNARALAPDFGVLESSWEGEVTGTGSVWDEDPVRRGHNSTTAAIARESGDEGSSSPTTQRGSGHQNDGGEGGREEGLKKTTNPNRLSPHFVPQFLVPVPQIQVPTQGQTAATQMVEDPTRSYRFVYPYLLAASSQIAYVWDIRTGEQVQIVENIQRISVPEGYGRDSDSDFLGGEGEGGERKVPNQGIAEIPPLAGVMSASGLPPSGEVSVRLRVEDEDALIDEEHHILGANAHATPHSTPQPGAVGSSSGGASSKEKGKGKEKATVQEEEDPTFPTFKPFKTGWWDTNSTFSGNAFNSSRATTKSSQGGKKRKGDPLALISNISMLLGGLNYVELGERWIFLCGQESLRVFARGKEFFECEGEDAHPSGSMSTPSTSSTSTSNQNHRSDAISNSASTSTSGDSAPTIIGRKPYLWTPEDFKTLPPGQLALRIPCDKIQYSRWSASLGPQSYRPHWGSEVVRQEVVWTEEMAGESEDSVNVGLVPSSAGGRMRQDDSWETHGLQATRNVFGGWGNPGWGYYDEEEEEEEEEEEREENGLGMMIKRRRRLYDEFVAVHISPCQNHLALLLSSSRLLFVPHFERLIKAEEDLWDVGVDLQLGSVGCPSVYLSYGSGEAQGGGSAGRVGVVTQQGIYIITPYLRQPFENSASPSFTRPVELIVMRLAPSFLDPRRLIDVSCLQMSDTGVWVNYDAPEPPKIEARINGLEFKGNDNLEKGEGKSKKVKKKKGNGMKSKSQKPPLSYHTAGKAHRWTSQQFPLGTTPPSQFQVQGGKCKWNDAEITWRKRRLEMSMERGATLHDDRFTKTLNEKRIDENGTGGHAVHELPNGDMVALPEDITGDRLTWIQQMRAKSEAHQIRFIPYEY